MIYVPNAGTFLSFAEAIRLNKSLTHGGCGGILRKLSYQVSGNHIALDGFYYCEHCSKIVRLSTTEVKV